MSPEAHALLKNVLEDKLPKGARVMDRGRVNVGAKGRVETTLIVPDWVEKAVLIDSTTSVDSLPPMLKSASFHKLDNYKRHILSVDDDAINQHVIGGMFGPEGFEIVVAMDGLECLEYIERAENGDEPWPNVVLLDNMMPGMGGVDVCKVLRKKHSHLELPVIMLTCRTVAEDICEALGAGCNDYMTKPFSRIELVARVRSQIRISRIYWALQQQVASSGESARNQELGLASPSGRALTPSVQECPKSYVETPVQTDALMAVSTAQETPSSSSRRPSPSSLAHLQLGSLPDSKPMNGSSNYGELQLAQCKQQGEICRGPGLQDQSCCGDMQCKNFNLGGTSDWTCSP